MKPSSSCLCLILLPLCSLIGIPGVGAQVPGQRRSDDMFLDVNSTATDIFRHILQKNVRGLKDRPNEVTGKPDAVNVSMYIESVRDISELDMEISFDMYLRFHWVDDRITFDSGPNFIILTPEIAKPHMWFPDFFFTGSHDVQLHSTLDSNSGIRIYKNGQVMVSARLTLVAHCDMDLKYFPHDVQVCSLNIESYMYSNDEVRIGWKDFSMSSTTPMNFKIEGHNHGVKLVELASGNYSKAYAELTMGRISTHYICMIYLPSILLVILSCLIFWLPTSALLERTLFGMFLMFCMTVIMIGSQFGSPVVGYLKAIDMWVISCFFFIVVALLEILLFHIIFGREVLGRASAGDQFELMSEEDGSNKAVQPIGPWTVRPDVAHKIDIALRIIYPSAFVLFNAIYWACNA